MKKIFFIVQTAVFLLVAGCGKENTPANTQKKEKSAEAAIVQHGTEIKQTASKTKKGNSGAFSYTLENKEPPPPRPEVIDESTNLRLEDATGDEKKTELPKDSLASKIADRTRKIKWAPQWLLFSGTGGSRLPAAASSADRSVIAVVELLGQENGPFSSRIVFLDTFNWSVLSVKELKEEKISQITFIPELNHLACWTDEQPELKKKSRIILLNCATGEILSSSISVGPPSSAFISGSLGERLYAAPGNGEKLYIFNVNGLTLEKTLNTDISSPLPAIAVSDGNSVLAIGGTGIVKFMEIAVKKFKKDLSVKLPEDYSPSRIIFIENTLVLSEKGGRTFFYTNGPPREIQDFSGDIMFHCKGWKKDLLVLETEKNNAVILYEIPELTEFSSFSPKKIKPYTSSPAMLAGILKRDKGNVLYLLDKQGNLMTFTKPGKRWKKSLIISPEK